MSDVTSTYPPVDYAPLDGAAPGWAAAPAPAAPAGHRPGWAGAPEQRPCPPLDTVLTQYVLPKGASDLHLSVGSPPIVRLRGELEPIPNVRPLRSEELKQMLDAVVRERWDRIETEGGIDTAYTALEGSRFRVNVFKQRLGLAAVFRAIPSDIPAFETLGLPPAVLDLARQPRGLVLVTGPTGSGKSTTLAAMLDHINHTRSCHILTIEDPIEFVHTSQRALINQRELGESASSFAEALRQGLRQDPDVVLVGEMRDLDTMSVALTAAETGHLVFGTMHTSSAPGTITRIVDQYPSARQGQVQAQLSDSLRAVVTQTLLPSTDGAGRAPACEVLWATSGVRTHIREGQLHLLPNEMQTGGPHGMLTLNKSLMELVRTGRVAAEAAMDVSPDVHELEQMLNRVRSSLV